ncbi:helix-turn-helix domain-containing protein [Georgenia sp. EYE_87]|uniref:helix-turn-helix domain-containing protein n=1 Tax=Georgenia sp. EYE_87 TaxID=2853448 RepID=UPI0027E2A680|nr:helix-turn-helix domain-containing protein [Georgenia sp. EYE_87]
MKPKHAETGGGLLTVGQAAAILGVSTDTVRRWERDGRVAGFRTPTGQRRFRQLDVERLLRPSGTSPSTARAIGNEQ